MPSHLTLAIPTEVEDERLGDDEIRVFYPLGHYHSPVPDTRELAAEPARSRVFPEAPHATPGIDWRGDAQVELWRKVITNQAPIEFADAPTGDPREYNTQQTTYPEIDAFVLQAMLRHLAPGRLIEIGSGFSSLVSAQVNRELLGNGMTITCIEPDPPDYIADGIPGISDLRVEQIQETPLELFEELGPNDVLFVDTSHVVKTGGDVPWIYNQIIPRLNPGVHVHIHDAFVPGEYPQKWVLDGWGWNEIYLIHSFLAFNRAFEIVFGVRWMALHHPELLKERFPHLKHEEAGGSLWIRRSMGEAGFEPA